MIDINDLRSFAKTAHYGHLPLEVSGSEMLELLDRLEAAEKAVTEAYQRGYETRQEEIEKERDALRAKIAGMEKQEPVTAQQRFQRQQEMMAVWLPWQTTELRKGRPARTVDVLGLNVEYRELYALPGAQPAPSIPEFCPCCGNIMRACMYCPNEDCNAVTATAEQSKYNKQHALARKASGAAEPTPEAKP